MKHIILFTIFLNVIILKLKCFINDYNKTFLQILLIHYIFERWGNTHTHTYTQKAMLIFKMFIYKLFYEKK
jgi:hypothetical protein